LTKDKKKKLLKKTENSLQPSWKFFTHY